ncbi:MAG TPA: dual specificity protein phosphatase family protein [Candidatus Obscuribacterales bacterium]
MLIFDKSDVIPNFRAVSAELFRGGQPTHSGFQMLKERGIRTVVNFRDEPPLISVEQRILDALGLDFISIPLSPFREPTHKEVEQFLEIISCSEAQPLFVHCLHGQDRTGAMVCIYRMAASGWGFDEAYAEMVESGFHAEFHHLRRAVLRFASRKGVFGGRTKMLSPAP